MEFSRLSKKDLLILKQYSIDVIENVSANLKLLKAAGFSHYSIKSARENRTIEKRTLRKIKILLKQSKYAR